MICIFIKGNKSNQGSKGKVISKVPSLGYQQRPPICRHAVSAVCTAVLQHVLSACCAAAKGLGPTTPPAPEGTWGSQRDPQKMQHKRFQASNLGSHAKPITQQGIISKIKASVAIPILQEELERFSAQLWTSTVLHYHPIL